MLTTELCWTRFPSCLTWIDTLLALVSAETPLPPHTQGVGNSCGAKRTISQANPKDWFWESQPTGSSGKADATLLYNMDALRGSGDPVPLPGAALIFEELLRGAGLWMGDDGEYFFP